jgi:glycine C-acetyltransferase
MADELLKKGVYVIDFFPWYQRIKHELECNLSAHIKEHLDKAIAAFVEVGNLNVV